MFNSYKNPNIHYKVMAKTSNFGLLAIGYWTLTSRHNLNIISRNKVFDHGTFFNQLQTFCSFLFEHPINLSTVIGLLSQIRMQCRSVGRTDGRTDAYTPSQKNVSNKSSSLQVGSANGTLVQLCIYWLFKVTQVISHYAFVAVMTVAVMTFCY